MNDPEAARRREVIVRMSEFCECAERAPAVRVNEASAEIDVLCRPRDESMSCFTLAIEIKAHTRVGDRELGRWIKQASDYVGATPRNGWPSVAASFVWLVGVDLHPSVEEQLRMDGMLQLAQHFRVGHARETPVGLTLLFGPSKCLYRRKREGWTPRSLEWLGAKRISGGTRKPLPH